MKKLNLGFRSATKNTMHHLQLNYVKTELEAEPLKKYMAQIAALGIFSNQEHNAPLTAQLRENGT